MIIDYVDYYDGWGVDSLEKGMGHYIIDTLQTSHIVTSLDKYQTDH